MSLATFVFIKTFLQNYVFALVCYLTAVLKTRILFALYFNINFQNNLTKFETPAPLRISHKSAGFNSMSSFSLLIFLFAVNCSLRTFPTKGTNNLFITYFARRALV